MKSNPALQSRILKTLKESGKFDPKKNQGKGHSLGRKVSYKVLHARSQKANLKLKRAKKARKIQRSRNRK